VKVWHALSWPPAFEPECFSLVQVIDLKAIPLALSAYKLDDGPAILATAGSRSSIDMYLSDNLTQFGYANTLSGHTSWIRSLDFVQEKHDSRSDLLLASASQDKFIRLWRIHKGLRDTSNRKSHELLDPEFSTKTHRLKSSSGDISVTFEALLYGHDDWVYSCRWKRQNGALKLLGASADNSLSIWEADQASGVWVCSSRLGDVSQQKGSTTATGSAGGFWNGLWLGDGSQVVSLGRTGSWRRWEMTDHRWVPSVGCGGHTKYVSGISWSKNGEYLLTTSHDQTTRLHAPWKIGDQSTWHEFSRPQIHGYDINCIDAISNSRFVTGADEKPLRVFEEPSIVEDILEQMCGIKKSSCGDLPKAASIPVLGLSNKATGPTEADQPSADTLEDSIPAAVVQNPPLEDDLAKHLLWPEIQKLYGHGFETSAVTTCNDGSLIATACKASSKDHAAIRVYTLENWQECTEPLVAHNLTVTGLQWSPDDKYLLSVSRDRTWTLFERRGHDFTTIASNGHNRMIMGCSWAPLEGGRLFATAGRDRHVKLWIQDGEKFVEKLVLTAETPVTAVAFLPRLIGGKICLAGALETGLVLIHVISVEGLVLRCSIALPKWVCPSKSVTGVSWRNSSDVDTFEIAVASEDASVKLFRLDLARLCRDGP
jgi:elongator complex protein 2